MYQLNQYDDRGQVIAYLRVTTLGEAREVAELAVVDYGAVKVAAFRDGQSYPVRLAAFGPGLVVTAEDYAEDIAAGLEDPEPEADAFTSPCDLPGFLETSAAPGYGEPFAWSGALWDGVDELDLIEQGTLERGLVATGNWQRVRRWIIAGVTAAVLVLAPAVALADGGAGDDILYGGAGRDVLWGGRGHDLLIGGPGRDVCYVTPGDVTRGCEVVA